VFLDFLPRISADTAVKTKRVEDPKTKLVDIVAVED